MKQVDQFVSLTNWRKELVDMKTCIKVFKDAKKYRIFICVGLLAVAIATVIQLYLPWVLKEITELAANGDQNIVKKSLHMGILLLFFYIIRGVCSFLYGYFTHYAAYHYVADTRKKLYDKVQNFSLGYFHDKQTGQIVSRILNDVVNAELLIAHVIPGLIINVLMFLGVAIMLFYINVKLALVSLISIPLLMYVNSTYSKYVLPLWRENQQILGELSGALHDNLSGIKEIQIFNKQNFEKERIGKLARKQTNIFLKATKSSEIFHPSITFLSSIGSVVVIIYGGYLNSIGEVSAADIVGFITYLSLLYQPINNLSGVNEQLNNAIAGCERVFEVLGEQSEVKEKRNAKKMKNITGNIIIDDVSFQYNPEIPVLNHISLNIKAGQTYAFVGATGVGKTTISSLLNRFYDPVQGNIYIDGFNLKEVTLNSLRDNISMVLQDTFLFHGTIYDNIAYGYEHATKEEIEVAAKAANAHQFIQELEHGYHTVIGERGVRLSGGQKQRISIARAILRDTPILILDEATSSLDNKTELEIQIALENLSKNRTTIVIAHRLSTIQKADVIVVLNQCEIAEMGTHEELLKRNGIYARMYSVSA